MTIASINWVLHDAPGLPAHAFGVLMGLANHARDDGTGAYASQATLAAYARKSDRAVRNDIKELLTLGLIVVSPNQNAAAHIPADVRPVVYDLQVHLKTDTPGSPLPDGSGSPLPDDARKPTSARKPTTGSPVPDARKPTSDKPSTNQDQKKTSSSSSSSDSKQKPKSPPAEHPRFAEFWSAYPLKVGKAKGREAFTNAVDVIGADPDTLIAAAVRYGRHLVRCQVERRYKLHPATWLNGERWEDQLDDEPDTPQQPPLIPDWCGTCDYISRTFEQPDGRWANCPDCHPDAERSNP